MKAQTRCRYLKMQINIGRTRVKLSFSFAAVLTLMLLLCDERVVLISIFSSLFHEGGHLFFMLIFAVYPSRVVFGAFGIRIEREKNRLVSYKKEALICMGGIFGNIVLFLSGVFFYSFYKSLWSLQLMAVNAFIAAFNMVPVSLLDFGNCLFCIISHKASTDKAEKTLSVVSQITVIILTLFCVAYNIFIGFNISFIAVTVYIILITTLKE